MSDLSGTVGIYTDKQGRVIATATDFDPDRPGGYTKFEAQRLRVEKRIARAVIDAYCSEVVIAAMRDHDCERLLRGLIANGGKVTIIAVGYEGAAA